MKNNIFTIIKKEFNRFFKDKRMVLTTIFLPGILIYVLYSFMGESMMKQFTTEDDYQYSIYVENEPASLTETLDALPAEVTQIDAAKEAEMKTSIEDKESDVLVVFPEDFDAAVAAYDSTAGGAAPQVAIYYNSTRTESQEGYQIISEIFNTYESALANKFDVNGGDASYDLASKEDMTGQFFSMMLPMLMMMFLFSGCMAIAPESIAGEKERGTIATLLVTPMKRSQLAVGKIVSLGTIGLLSGISSFIGTMLSLPKMMSMEGEDAMSASVYQAMDYILLLFIILTTVLVIVGALAVISALAKSVKEAGTAITPLMILVMVVSITTMMGNGAPKEFYWYLIPFYNSVQCMNGIFSFSYLPVNIIITVAANLVYTFILAGVLAKIFDSEKIMYN